MKKVLCLLLSFLMVVTLPGCTTHSDNNDKYKYADAWNKTEMQPIKALEYVKPYAKAAATAEYSDALQSIKEAINTTIMHSDFLDWDRFQKVQNVYELDISTDDVGNMTAEELIIFSSYVAMYDEDRNVVYILPQFYTATPETQMYCLIHEALHSLVPNWNSVDDSSIVEGLIDWLALQVCGRLGINVTASYQESILCLCMMMDIYGEDTVVQAICEDRIVELIDNSTKAGMARKLSVALFVIHGSNNATMDDIRTATYVELDILCHAARHEGVDISRWIDNIDRIYKSNGIALDLSYFT